MNLLKINPFQLFNLSFILSFLPHPRRRLLPVLLDVSLVIEIFYAILSIMSNKPTNDELGLLRKLRQEANQIKSQNPDFKAKQLAE